MNILLIGSGAREHALALKVLKSDLSKKLLVWPGSAVLNRIAERLDIGQDARWEDVARMAKNQGVDFVIVGPELPLEDGLADACEELHLPCFGPKKSAAALETSKVFSKQVMAAAGIPTAAFFIATGREECLETAVRVFSERGGVVIKASGLASGKGVFVCRSLEDIETACKRLYSTGLSHAASMVVIEEILEGRECSFFVFLGAGEPTPLGFAVDYKRLSDDDVGPNTGGMGCYTPVPWLPSDASDQVMKVVVRPLLEELRARGISYTGCLYVGLMWESQGFSVVEFNARLGDPEAEVLALHDKRDWVQLMASKLSLLPLNDERFLADAEKNTGATVAVVMASSCYPFSEQRTVTYPISPEVFSSGSVLASAVRMEGETLTSGKGRVLAVLGHGEDFASARTQVYAEVNRYARDWPLMQFRKDIGLNVR